MKIIAIITSLVLSFSAVAGANHRAALEQSFDEYQFALTTEWNQKDQTVLRQINAKLEKEIVGLMDSGLTDADIFAVLERRALSKTEIEGLKLRASMIARAGSTTDALMILKDELGRSSQQGASWNGSSTLGLVAIGAFFVGIIVFMVALTKEGECLEEAEYLDCDNSGNDCYYVTRCKTYSL